MSNQQISYNVQWRPRSVCVSSITFNGSHFVCLDAHSSTIFLLNEGLKLVRKVDLKHKYSSLCFDITDNCYWAISDYKASVLYQLDYHFNEINQIQLKNVIDSTVNGISHNYKDGGIWILFCDCMGYLGKGRNKITYIPNKGCSRTNQAITVLPFGALIAYENQGKPYLELYNQKMCINLTDCVSATYRVREMCIFSISNSAHTYKVALVVVDVRLSKLLMMIYSINHHKDGSLEMRCVSSQEFDWPYSYNEPPCESYYQPPQHDPYCNPCNDPCCNPYDDPYCDSCDDPCCDPCDDPCCDPCDDPCCDPCDDPCCDPCDDPCHNHCKKYCRKCCKAKIQIIESIALEEMAISQILSAEGEKIHKSIEEFESINQLLAINESVKQTITQLTQLETQLYLKLDSLNINQLCKQNFEEKCPCHED